MRKRMMRSIPVSMIAACTAMVSPVLMGAMVFAGTGAKTGLPVTVAMDNPLRKPLLNAARNVVEKDLGQPVRFIVRTLKVQGNWAYAVLLPRTPGGGIIDFRKTHHADRVEAGIMDGDISYVLLRRDGTDWHVRDFAIGPTDVTYAGWPGEYGAPATLFGLPEGMR